MKTLLALLILAGEYVALPQNLSEKVHRFRTETNLAARTGMIGELAQIGGDQAFQEFKRCLFDKRLAERQLNFKEEAFMLSLLQPMGYLAATSNVVRDFLLDAVHPEFWRTNILWRTELGDDEYSVLAGRALGSLATSGREEFGAIAERIKQDIEAKKSGGYLVGGLVDAHFRKQLVAKKGWKAYSQMSADETMDEFYAWKKTPQGTNWYLWHRQKMN